MDDVEQGHVVRTTGLALRTAPFRVVFTLFSVTYVFVRMSCT